MRGLLMIEPLYHQAVAGKKTQTRRSGGLEAVNDTSQQMNGHVRSADDCELMESHYDKSGRYTCLFNKPSSTVLVEQKSRYKLDEVLYLKEPISVHSFITGRLKETDTSGKTIKAHDVWENLYKYGAKDGHGISKAGMLMDSEVNKWQNKLFMPESAARAYVKITSIKCERLLDISVEDCIAEGIEATQSGLYKYYANEKHKNISATLPFSSFLSLYKFANKVKDVKNLWVWAYTFEYLPNYRP